MLDPEQVASLLFWKIDRYTESEWHFLVVPWKDIPTIREVNSDDLELLEMMDIFGRKIVYENIRNESIGVIQELEKYGRIDLPSTLQCKNFLKTMLKCHKCSHMPKNINDLTNHLLVHMK